MPVPILWLDEEVRHFAQRFRQVFSKRQYQHARDRVVGSDADVEGARTLWGLVQPIAERPSVAEVSRFLSQAPWEEATVAQSWLRHLREEREPKVAAQRERERQRQPKRRGRPKAAVVTGYLIGDDSTMRQQQSQEDGRIGQASLDDPGEAPARSEQGRASVCAVGTTWSAGSPDASTISGLQSGRGALREHDRADGNDNPHL